MINVIQTRIDAGNVASLTWHGDMLVDWAQGGTRYTANEMLDRLYTNFGSFFDAAITSPSTSYSALYGKLGTKGLLFRDGEMIREINRSYYWADAYEYPIAFAQLRNGREVLIHCPDEYNRLEIDDLETGECLTASTRRTPGDFFHSRLACSTDGSTLLSAGWIWHPQDAVCAFDIDAALANPALLDRSLLSDPAWGDESSATFLADGRIAVALTGIENADGDMEDRSELRLIDLHDHAATRVVPLTERAGTMMAVGTHHLLTLHQFPRLINIDTGLVEQSWPHFASGEQSSSILISTGLPPTIALDVVGQRCAIADATGITILAFTCA